MEGGFLKSLKRAALGGESFFMTTYTAPSQGGFVDVAARLPGDIISYDLSTGHRAVHPEGLVAGQRPVGDDRHPMGRVRELFGSEGGFIIRAEGQGPVVFGCYGALETWNLEAGQTITIDTGHMVAYESTITMTLRKAGGGLVQTFKSGEGIVFDFTGPGKVMSQTRNPNELLGWIQAAVGTGNSGGAGMGGLFGRD